MRRLVFALVIIATFGGCNKNKCDYNECAIKAPDSEIQAVQNYLSSKGITNAVQHCSGMFYVIDNAGNGKHPTACSTVDTVSGVSAYTITPAQSSASYEVQEQFLNQNLPSTAKGTTKDISGGFVLKLTNAPTMEAMKITVDLRTLTSDENRRDERIRENWLESNKYPNAVFTVKDPQTLPADYANGKEVSFNLTGDLTIHGVTRQETFKVTGKLDNDTVTGKATASILMANYGIDPPNIAGFLTVKDGVTLTFDFIAQKSACAQIS